MLGCKVLIVCIAFSSLCYGQTSGDSLFIINQSIKDIVFVKDDSTYKFTRVIQDDGVFMFSDFPFDSILLMNYKTKTTYSFDRGNTVVTKYRVSYRWIPGRDTIYNYFHSREESYGTTSLSTILYELKYSYILQQLEESILHKSLTDFVRIIWPCEEVNGCTAFIVSGFEFSNETIILRYTLGESLNSGGIQIANKDSIILKKRDFRKLKKNQTKLNDITDFDCIKDGNPLLLESKIGQQYKSFMISNNCSVSRKQTLSILRLYGQFNQIAARYMPFRCKKDSRIYMMH